MTNISSRVTEWPYLCPFCRHLVAPGEVIAVVAVNTTYSSGCVDCAWAAINGELPTRQVSP